MNSETEHVFFTSLRRCTRSSLDEKFIRTHGYFGNLQTRVEESSHPLIPKKKNTNFKDMLRWYLLTLMIRQRVQMQNQVSNRHLFSRLPRILGLRQDQNSPRHGQIELKERSKQHEWVISIKDKLEQAYKDDDRSSRGKLCIYKVPRYLHVNEKDNKSYFPQTVSIGPYHRGKEQTLSMECHKWRAVNKVLKRTNQCIEVYIDAMANLEEKARACYEGPISMSSTEFIEMLVLDGCFILELLGGVAGRLAGGFTELGYDRNDPVFAFRGSMHSIQRDMIMLENQLPLFILSRLLELQLGTQNQTSVVAKLAVEFFNPLMPTAETLDAEGNYSASKGIIINPSVDDLGELHCLDVFRRSLLLPNLEPKPSGKKWSWDLRVADKRLQRMIPSVTELKDAGFQFRVGVTHMFWDINFNDGYLEIPSLFIHDGTKSLFLNLIAFGQCHIDSSNNITSYIIFMDNLIDCPEDISYLRQCGIIEHSLGSNAQVADMFNQLCHEVVFNKDDIYLSQLLDKVKRCYEQKYFRKWNAWKRILRHKYFDNPWAYLSFFAALILLILTLAQSYFAAYAYFYPTS